MESIISKINTNFKLYNFRKIFLLTWLFIGVGIVLLILFSAVSITMPRRSFFSYFFQIFGAFVMATFILMAYGGVYYIVTAPEITKGLTRRAIRASFGKAHYFFTVSLVTLLFMNIVVMLETGLSTMALVPGIGALVMALLTIPLFIVNALIVLAAITVFAVSPPLIIESNSIRGVFNEYRISLKTRWVSVVLYLIISLSIFALSLMVIYFLLSYINGITKAVQWSISGAYHRSLDLFTYKSYFSQLVYSIIPRSGMVSALDKFGYKEFIYPDLIKFIILFSYTAIGSFAVSFPLAVYFNVSSFFFGDVKMK